MESQEPFEYDWLDRVVSAQGDYGLFHIRMILWEIEYRRMAYTYNEMNVMKS